MSTRCPPPPSRLPDLESRDIADWDDYVVRIYSSKGAHAARWSSFRRYGPVSSTRFDHQPLPTRLHPTRGVSYAAGAWTASDGHVTDPLEVAVLERFQSSGVIDRGTDGPRYVIFEPTRPLKLLQLTDSNWLARAGGNAALVSGARGMARDWSRAIYRGYPDVDGLIWSSSVLPPGRSMVLYERAANAVPPAPASDRALQEPFLQPALGRIAGTFGLTLL